MELAVKELESEVQQVWGVEMKIKEESESEMESSESSNQQASDANDIESGRRDASADSVHIDVEKSARDKEVPVA